MGNLGSLSGKTAVFFNLPLHGHINPSLSFIEELCSRGLELHYFSTIEFKDKIAATGAIFHDYPKPTGCLDLILSGNWVDTLLAVYTFIEDQVDELIVAAKEIKPDCVLYDFMSPWGKIVADKLGYSVKTISLYATFMMRTELIPWMVQSALQLPKHIIQRRAQALHVIKQRREIYKRYGLSLPFLKTLAVDGDLNFIFTSRQFHPAGNLIRNDRYIFLGNTNKNKASNGTIDPTKPWNQSPKPVIYASLGTLYNDNPVFFENLIYAFKDYTDVTVIISFGGRWNPKWSVHRLAMEYSHIHLFRFVPQLEVLSKTSVFITHGGMGSASEGGLAGVAMVNCPQQQEQKMVSARIQAIGAGIDLEVSTPSAQQIFKAAKLAIDTPKITEQSKKMGEMLRASTSLEQGADLLEIMINPEEGLATKQAMFQRNTGGLNLFLN